MKLEDALKQNPYDKTRGSKGAYIRYLRYTVDGWYSKKSEEIRKQIDLIIPGLSEPPVRTLRATCPENESHIFR